MARRHGLARAIRPRAVAPEVKQLVRAVHDAGDHARAVRPVRRELLLRQEIPAEEHVAKQRGAGGRHLQQADARHAAPPRRLADTHCLAHVLERDAAALDHLDEGRLLGSRCVDHAARPLRHERVDGAARKLRHGAPVALLQVREGEGVDGDGLLHPPVGAHLDTGRHGGVTITVPKLLRLDSIVHGHGARQLRHDGVLDECGAESGGDGAHGLVAGSAVAPAAATSVLPLARHGHVLVGGGAHLGRLGLGVELAQQRRNHGCTRSGRRGSSRCDER